MEGGFGMKIALGFFVFIMICMMFLAVPVISQTDQYYVVANKQLQGTSIDKAALKGIYLREIRNWGNDGGEIIPVDLSSEKDFYQNLFSRSYIQMQAYWLKMRINHSVSMPVTKKDPESVKSFIASNKNAIGFIRTSDFDDRVKILKVIEK